MNYPPMAPRLHISSFAKQNTIGRETSIRNMKQSIEKAKHRSKELDMLIE